MKNIGYSEFRPMKVQIKPGSHAEEYYRSQAGLPGNQLVLPRAIAPGIKPSPLHDLIFHGGKTVPRMQFQNLYLGGEESWKETDIASIDRAIQTAMSDKQLNNVMVQYFPGESLACTALVSKVLEGNKPPQVSQGDAEQLIRRLHARGCY